MTFPLARQILLAAALAWLPSKAPAAQGAFDRSPAFSLISAPSAFSDRDETSASATVADLAREAVSPDGVRGLTLAYDIRPNTALGYQYAGVAFPLLAPMAAVADGKLSVSVFSDRPLSSIELVLRDTQRHRAVVRVTAVPANSWTTLQSPVAAFTGIDAHKIADAAVAVTEPGRGTLRVTDLVLPCASAPLPALPSAPASAEPAIAWSPDVTAALAEAQRGGRKVLVFFTIPDSAICRSIEDAALADPAVARRIGSNYVAVKIDMKREASVAQQLGVYRAGIFNIYDSSGACTRQLTTVRSGADLLREL